jgi:hypothetical protein
VLDPCSISVTVLTFSLQSGSNGNSIYVEADGARLLFDAGISGTQAALRMAAHGREIRDCQALILSHEHSDHTSCAGIFHRKFGLPVYCTKATYRARQRQLGTVNDVRHFDPGQTLAFGKVRVHTVPTPHDARDTVCFVIEHGHKRLGIFTDLGHPTPAIRSALAEVDAAYLESNYEPDMLWSGSYRGRRRPPLQRGSSQAGQGNGQAEVQVDCRGPSQPGKQRTGPCDGCPTCMGRAVTGRTSGFAVSGRRNTGSMIGTWWDAAERQATW